MHIGLHVKYCLFLSDFNYTSIFSTDSRKIIKYQISWISVQWDPSCFVRTDGRTDGRIDEQTDRHDETKDGDTLSSRHVSSCDVRLQLGYLTLNSGAKSHFCQLCLRHVIWRGAIVGSRASTPLKFLLSHTFRETWRTCRVLFNIVTSCFQKWRKSLLKKWANGPFYVGESNENLKY
jgi:hypothetical protein